MRKARQALDCSFMVREGRSYLLFHRNGGDAAPHYCGLRSVVFINVLWAFVHPDCLSNV